MKFCMFAGVIIALVIVAVFKFIIYSRVKKDKGKCPLKIVFKYLAFFFFFLILPDYFLQDILKKRFKEKQVTDKQEEHKQEDNKQEKSDSLTKCVTMANSLNLGISIVVSLFSCLTVKLFNSEAVYWIVFGCVVYRTWSRTMEINIAFIKDIKSAKKETNLNASQRIYLAIKSLVEEIFLFAGVYFFLLAKDESFITAMSGGLHSISFEVFSCENINTLLKGCAPWFNFVAVYQKACALILISLAIAGYLNSDNRCRNKYESDDNNDKKNDFTQT